MSERGVIVVWGGRCWICGEEAPEGAPRSRRRTTSGFDVGLLEYRFCSEACAERDAADQAASRLGASP